MNQPDQKTRHEFTDEFSDESLNDSIEESVDESMMSLSDMVEDLVEPFEPEQDEHQFLSMSLQSIHLDMPVQLQVAISADGKVTLGITPPLYKIETSFEPVFHQIKFTCAVDE
jgi:hypothetical protein